MARFNVKFKMRGRPNRERPDLALDLDTPDDLAAAGLA